MYRLIDLGEGVPCQTLLQMRGFGLNEHGDTVGMMECQETGHPRSAWRWIFRDPNGARVATLLDTTTQNEAYEINDDRVAVGLQGPTGSSEAVVWEATGPTILVPQVDGVHPLVAWSISDDAPYEVVGDWNGGSGRDRAFSWVNGRTPDLLAPRSWPGSAARDISTPDMLPRIVGGQAFKVCTGVCAVCASAHADATAWELLATELAQPYESVDQPGQPIHGIAYGVNDLNVLVGTGRENLGGQFDCADRALYWESKDDLVPTILADVFGARAPDDDILAYAVNVSSLVVGTNDDQTLAGRWTLDDPSSPDNVASWSFADLNTKIVSNCQTEWVLVSAWDVNDSGWIVGEGLRNLETRAFLLIPEDDDFCAPDVNGDAKVDVQDLVLIFLSWGETCAGFPDVDNSGVVAVNDLVEVILGWGCCPGESCTPPPSLQAVIIAAGLDWPQDWDAFMQVLTTGTPAEQENWICWMDHYLTGATPSCLGTDPFD